MAVRYFSARVRGRKRSSPMQLVALRLADLSILFRSRYGITLPDDDAGREDIKLAVDHLAALPHPAKAITRWLETWAPWMTMAEHRQTISDGIANQRHWKADHLAWRLRLTAEERRVLGIKTIGAIDLGKAARTKLRKEQQRKLKAAKRRAACAVPRVRYEENSIERKKPWEAEGISRRTWYRRRKRDGQEGQQDREGHEGIRVRQAPQRVQEGDSREEPEAGHCDRTQRGWEVEQEEGLRMKKGNMKDKKKSKFIHTGTDKIRAQGSKVKNDPMMKKGKGTMGWGGGKKKGY